MVFGCINTTNESEKRTVKVQIITTKLFLAVSGVLNSENYFLSDVIANQIKMYFRKMKHKQTELYISEPIESDSEGNALTIEDIISSNINVEQIAELKIDSERLYRFILEELDEREREIICKRYGVADVDGSVCRPMTQKEIAKNLGISRSYISRIEKRALEKLRARFEKV